MRIQFLTDAFNGMAQRLWLELDRLNHEVKVQITGSAASMLKAVQAYQPELIIAPYLTVKIPAKIWQQYTCFIVHPGIPGDRGAASLDWAILKEVPTWGVSVIQATDKMDAGPVWATCSFPMRSVSKAQLYRHEVTQAAATAVLAAIEKFMAGGTPEPPAAGKWQRSTTQDDFRFRWQEDTKSIIRRIRAADSSPGVLVNLFDKEFYAYGAHAESRLAGEPGTVLAQRDEAVCVATGNAAVWLTHLKSIGPEEIKLPATRALGQTGNNLPADTIDPFANTDYPTWREIYFHQEGDIGYLHFEFYNGAMSTTQCQRLLSAFRKAKERVKLIVLMGGQDVWSNGIHLNVIENAADPAGESWGNINALNDLIREIILSTDHYIISALHGNAGAGGVALALAADKILAREGVVLNPHTKNMGLFGSEYWTYLLPKRIGLDKATKFTEECLPWGVATAHEIGLIDDYHGNTVSAFDRFVREQANAVSNLPYFSKLLQAKKFQRQKDEMNKPLQEYREAELDKMKANFFANTWYYHEKRYNFVHKIANEETTELADLYSSRRAIYRKRKWEPIRYADQTNER